MIRTRSEFQVRAAEIDAYFAHISAVEEGIVVLVAVGGDVTVPAYSPAQKEDLLRTFKASGFLMLYNLMEATVKNAVEAIFDELTTQGVTFDACRREVRIVVFNNLKQSSNADHLKMQGVTHAVDLFNDLASDAVTRTFQREKIVSGNVDAREIKGLADEYGFGRPSAPGHLLLTVKTARNDLAHGAKSFAEVGRDYDLPQLLGIKTAVVDYLSAFITSVADYLTNRHYLVAPGRP